MSNYIIEMKGFLEDLSEKGIISPALVQDVERVVLPRVVRETEGALHGAAIGTVTGGVSGAVSDDNPIRGLKKGALAGSGGVGDVIQGKRPTRLNRKLGSPVKGLLKGTRAVDKGIGDILNACFD